MRLMRGQALLDRFRWVGKQLLPLAFFSMVGLSVATAAPSITSLSTTSGPINTPVTITGTGFGATQSTSTVKFNGTVATATSWTATSITVKVPTGATTGPVIVNVAGTNSTGVAFNVVPHINSLSLTSGPTQMGFVVSGTTFGASQGTSSIKIGTLALSVISWTATAITVAVPTGATTGSIVVTVSSNSSNGVTFTVASPFGCS